ncbi:protein of unknown function [Candidatus Filomicrobium marinum]|uniref:Uncharacterized protein n=1 Tax=Candidatus Filomicrobium marinum TaxID=1608628 RepID=A0A0D6JK05_9HYPH|nr:protein of unknown function [Candidatus Filomicrobium marinum]CPR22281.1 protein of unknown function [Candidatus Filomicrobium marinum]
METWETAWDHVVLVDTWGLSASTVGAYPLSFGAAYLFDSPRGSCSWGFGFLTAVKWSHSIRSSLSSFIGIEHSRYVRERNIGANASSISDGRSSRTLDPGNKCRDDGCACGGGAEFRKRAARDFR